MSYYGIHHWNAKNWSHGSKKPPASVAEPRTIRFIMDDSTAILVVVVGVFLIIGLEFLIKAVL
jgi:hypothetical protein